jgi:hypothetical protein
MVNDNGLKHGGASNETWTRLVTSYTAISPLASMQGQPASNSQTVVISAQLTAALDHLSTSAQEIQRKYCAKF